MRRILPPPHELVLPALLVLLICLMAFVGYHFNQGEDRRELVSMQIAMERIAVRLLWSYNEIDVTDPAVLGFGLYSAGGLPVGTPRGTAPPTLRLADRPKSGEMPEYRLDHSRKAIALIMRLGLSEGQADSDSNLPGLRFLYVDVNNPEFFDRMQAFQRYRIAIPVAAAFGVAIAAFLTLRLAQYKKTVESQRNAARLGETARVLSHEMKNPLSAIRLEIDYLRRLLPEQQADSLRRFDVETQRLVSLTRRIEDLLREPAGGPETVDAAIVVSELARQQGVRWRVDGQHLPALVRFDRDAFRSVLENLVSNALESGGPCEGVEMLLNTRRNEVEITVGDRGRGIPQVLRQRVFDLFYTTKLHGSGIGLAIVRRFVTAAGGRITFRTRTGGGTEAALTLTRVHDEDSGR